MRQRSLWTPDTKESLERRIMRQRTTCNSGKGAIQIVMWDSVSKQRRPEVLELVHIFLCGTIEVGGQRDGARLRKVWWYRDWAHFLKCEDDSHGRKTWLDGREMVREKRFSFGGKSQPLRRVDRGTRDRMAKEAAEVREPTILRS